MTPVTIGIIGCGSISGAYLRGARNYPILRVKACADLDRAVAERRAAEFGITAMSVDALLADPEIEIVVNLTVPQAHVAVGLAAVAAGKHVHSEKPLSVSTADARRLLDEAARRGLRVGCAPDTFLGGAHQAARRLIDEGAIGRPVAGTAFMMNHGHEHWHPNPAFYYRPGGGPMLDMGPYYLTALVNLLGPIARVCGSARIPTPRRTVSSEPRRGEVIEVTTPTHLTGVLEFEGGAVVTIATSFDVWKHRHLPLEIYGTEGALTVPDPNFFGGAPELSSRGGAWTPQDIAAHPFGAPNRELRDGTMVADYRIAGVVDLAWAIRRDRPHRASGALAYHVLEAMAAFQISSESGRWVGIESRCERPEPLPQGAGDGELG